MISSLYLPPLTCITLIAFNIITLTAWVIGLCMTIWGVTQQQSNSTGEMRNKFFGGSNHVLYRDGVCLLQTVSSYRITVLTAV